MTIVVLVGRMGSGKTTVADILASYNYTNITFAEPIKAFASALLFTDNELNGTQSEKLAVSPLWGVSGRKFMQMFGTEICRDTLCKLIPSMSQLFIRVVEQKILNATSNIVISDCRFLDELAMAKRLGAIVVKIVRGKGHAMSTHISESELDTCSYDIIINNNNTIENLELQLIDKLSLDQLHKQTKQKKYWYILALYLVIAFANLLLIIITAEYLL